MEKSCPEKDSHPPSRVYFSKNLYEKKVDPFVRAKSFRIILFYVLYFFFYAVLTLSDSDLVLTLSDHFCFFVMDRFLALYFSFDISFTGFSETVFSAGTK